MKKGISLTEEQKKILKGVFKEELDLSIIRVFVGGWVTGGGYSRTLGNNIYFLTYPPSNHTLIHEAAHSWQYQNAEGWPYMYAVQSLFEYSKDFFSDMGLRSFCAYSPLECKRALEIAAETSATDYSYYKKMGIPFTEWNPEAQAEWIADNEKLPWHVGG